MRESERSCCVARCTAGVTCSLREYAQAASSSRLSRTEAADTMRGRKVSEQLIDIGCDQYMPQAGFSALAISLNWAVDNCSLSPPKTGTGVTQPRFLEVGKDAC